MKVLTFLGLVFFLSPAHADYVISVNHLKNGNKTIMTDIGYYNSMSDCKNAVVALLERAGLHTGGSWFIGSEDAKNICGGAGYFYSSGTCDWPTDGCVWFANTGTDSGSIDECPGTWCEQCGAWWV